MAYRMSHLTDEVSVGIRSDGSLHIEIEVPDPHGDARETIAEEIVVPAEAVSELRDYLNRRA